MVERDRFVIALVELYGLTTQELIARSVLNGAHATMASKIASRLCAAKKLVRREFRCPGGRRWCYYQPAGANPPGPEALARALTVANFCIHGGTPKLSAAAMRETYSFMPKGDYCLMGDG